MRPFAEAIRKALTPKNMAMVETIATEVQAKATNAVKKAGDKLPVEVDWLLIGTMWWALPIPQEFQQDVMRLLSEMHAFNAHLLAEQATLQERLEDLAQDNEQLRAKDRLHAHIRTCEVCSGPDDGCATGQELEHICIDQLGFDPYEVS